MYLDRDGMGFARGGSVFAAQTSGYLGGQMSNTQSQTVLPAVTGHWWALALRGVIAILFGLAAFLRPGIALEALILLFGAYALVDGVFAIVGTFGQSRGDTPRWLLLAEGGAGVVAGLVALIFPGITAVALLYLVAAWAVVTGVSEIAMAIRLREEIQGEWAMIVGGAVSVVFGLILAVLPWVGILSLVWLVGLYAVAFGILMVITALQVRGKQGSEASRSSRVS